MSLHSSLAQPACAARAPARRRARCTIVTSASPQRQQGSATAAGAAASQSAADMRASRRAAMAALVASIAAVKASPVAAADTNEFLARTDAEWRALLSPEAYAVLRRNGTEPRGASPLLAEKRRGTFTCGGCGQALFASETKYESGTGWPSFFDVLPGAVLEELDTSISYMPRMGVLCSRCRGHLGHVFNDGPPPTGLRYCMNGVALGFEPASA